MREKTETLEDTKTIPKGHCYNTLCQHPVKRPLFGKPMHKLEHTDTTEYTDECKVYGCECKRAI